MKKSDFKPLGYGKGILKPCSQREAKLQRKFCVMTDSEYGLK